MSFEQLSRSSGSLVMPVSEAMSWRMGRRGWRQRGCAWRERRGEAHSSAKASIGRTVQDPPIAHLRTRAVYQGTRGNEGSLTRRETVLLAQLRSGHCLKLAAYHKIIDDTADPMCPQCGREPETVEHWLQQCPASAARRVAEFGVASPPLNVLFQDPVAVLAFSRGSWAV